MTTDNTTPAQAAGLKAYSRVYEDGIFRDFNLASDVDALLQRQAAQADGDLKLLWKKKEELAEKDRQISELVAALKELHAMTRGECPSLLNEDSGGNGQLGMQIEDLLAQHAAPKAI